jgi:pSer/pThr/pTyr-binding forkhead associated (FHA) protein
MDSRTPSDDVQATGTLPATREALAEPIQETPVERPSWVLEARSALEAPGRYLAYEDDGRRVVAAVEREWTRIGRSLAADVRFDDATVSRRHALLVCQADGVRVLDDRSLNGVYVNGSRVEWRALTDGDRIAVGRHTLWFLDTSAVLAGEPAEPLAARSEHA